MVQRRATHHFNLTFLPSALMCKRKIAHISVTVRVRDGGLGAEITWSLKGVDVVPKGGQSQEVENALPSSSSAAAESGGWDGDDWLWRE